MPNTKGRGKSKYEPEPRNPIPSAFYDVELIQYSRGEWYASISGGPEHVALRVGPCMTRGGAERAARRSVDRLRRKPRVDGRYRFKA